MVISSQNLPHPSSSSITNINHLLEPKDNHQSAKLITLTSMVNNSIHFHDEAARILNRYQAHDIAFIGIWGAELSDKTYFYDKILKLCGI